MNKNNINIFLLFTLILSIVAIFLIKYVYVNVEEKWEFGFETGEIIFNLSLAFIASFIFYVIVVLVPEKRNRKLIYEQATKITNSIFILGSTILREPNDKLDFDKEIDQVEFMDKCLRTGPNLPQDWYSTPTMNKVITYREGINNKRNAIQKEIQSLFIYITYLEIEHIKLINDILDSQLIANMDAYFSDIQYTKNVNSFEFISPALYDFYKKIRLLKKYTNV
jgi:hypothetical protein